MRKILLAKAQAAAIIGLLASGYVARALQRTGKFLRP